jgi:hypothetical protein
VKLCQKRRPLLRPRHAAFLPTWGGHCSESTACLGTPLQSPRHRPDSQKHSHSFLKNRRCLRVVPTSSRTSHCCCDDDDDDNGMRHAGQGHLEVGQLFSL